MIQCCIMAKIIVDTAEIYDTIEASRLLGIGYATLYRWIKDSKLIAIKMGGRTLIPKSEIDRITKEKATEDESSVA